MPLALDEQRATDTGGARAWQHTRKDVSIALRAAESGVVDQVLLTTDADGYRFAKVRVRAVRTPQIGDKFAARHGQKGTVGITYRQEDMPFTLEAITPDLIINPHAIPSRMTVGQLVECLLGKVSSLQNVGEGDATPFSQHTVEHISAELHRSGYQLHGNEAMFHGHTGRLMDARIFLGPTYYQRLKHMVDDKIHSRARGPVTKLTRQPLEGRGRDGGLRFGEMERDWYDSSLSLSLTFLFFFSFSILLRLLLSALLPMEPRPFSKSVSLPPLTRTVCICATVAASLPLPIFPKTHLNVAAARP